MEEIIDLCGSNLDNDVSESVMYTTECIKNYDKIKQENSLFCNILEKFLSIENSTGMLSLINRKLLVSFNEADAKYKSSLEFQQILSRTLKYLNNYPEYKCTRIQFLCKVLSGSKIKKRVSLISLDENGEGKLHLINNLNKKNYISLIEKSLSHCFIKHKFAFAFAKPLDKTVADNSVKEDVKSQSDRLVKYVSNNSEKHSSLDSNNSNEECKSEENKLLVPVKCIEFCSPEHSDSTKVKDIEKKIAIYKRRIAKLDEEEVCNDSINSPYMKSEKLKSKIVQLYRELCELTGEQLVTKGSVRIKAMGGHPPGPLKRLETFLNDNIGNDGHPQFPNFRDVVKCVLAANNEDNLGWNKPRVMSEARALFIYCGRALQKRRQKREYEDLMSKVEVCDDDPADQDPGLLAKLKENRQIAIRKESEILQKFTMMQTSQTDKAETTDDIYSDEDFDSVENSPNVSTNIEMKVNTDVNMNERVENGENNKECVNIKQEPIDNAANMVNGLGDHTTNEFNHPDPFLVIEILDSSEEEYP